MQITRKSAVLALALGLGLAGSATLPAEYLGDVFVEPLGLVPPFDGAAVGLEWAIPSNQSLKLQVRANGRGDYPAPAEIRNTAAIEAGWRIFFSRDRQMRGFFLGPQVGVGVQNDTYYDANDTRVTASGTYLKGGIEFGHQWILGPGFVLTPALNGYFIPAYAVGSGRASENGRIYTGVALNLGWAFSR
jgi:hypothetical protein